jgi:hypothetical protein
VIPRKRFDALVQLGRIRQGEDAPRELVRSTRVAFGSKASWECSGYRFIVTEVACDLVDSPWHVRMWSAGIELVDVNALAFRHRTIQLEAAVGSRALYHDLVIETSKEPGIEVFGSAPDVRHVRVLWLRGDLERLPASDSTEDAIPMSERAYRDGSITCTEMFLNSGAPAINVDAEDDFEDEKVATILLTPDKARALRAELARCLRALGERIE